MQEQCIAPKIVLQPISYFLNIKFSKVGEYLRGNICLKPLKSIFLLQHKKVYFSFQVRGTLPNAQVKSPPFCSFWFASSTEVPIPFENLLNAFFSK